MSTETAVPPFTSWTVVPSPAKPAPAWLGTTAVPAAEPAWSPLVRPTPGPAPASPAVEEDAAPAACLTEEELASACAAAAQLAVEQERSAGAALERQARAAALEQLAGALGAVTGAYEDCLDRIAESSALLLDALLEAAGLAGRLPVDGMRATLRATLAETLRAPSLRIEVAPAFLAVAGDVVREAATGAALPAMVELSAAAGPAAAMRIEWSDGWAETDRLRAVELLRTRLAGGLADLPDNGGHPAIDNRGHAITDNRGHAARSDR